MAVQGVEQLHVWQRSMDLVEDVYRVTKDFPASEMYGLTSQLRRAAVSIAANIAEGQGRDSTKEFLHFLSVARGSLVETRTELIISNRIKYLPDEMAQTLLKRVDEVGRLLSGLQRSLRTKL